jgi:putative membrane protein
MMYGGYGGFGWIGMILGLVVTIAVIVLLVAWAVRRTNGNTPLPTSQNTTGQSARDIAQVRYAKGEINRDEYQKIIGDLGS